MKKLIIILSTALALSAGAFAQGPQGPAPKPETHFKWYGFIRSYFAFDTHVSSAGTEDLYFYMPKDQNIVDGVDLNETASFRFAALTSRIGVDVLGYEVKGYKVGAKIEADFYSGVSGVTGTAQLRLRQAYVTLDKKGRSWKIGQAWHPMAADLPDIFSLESGAPFGPFSRTPLVALDLKMGSGMSLTAAAIWQMQYTSTGPEGAVANYIKYGCTPEMYLGLNYKGGSSVVKAGVDVLSIKPRQYNEAGTAKVSDRLTTFNVFEYGQFKAGDFTIKEKVTYANDGSHMNMVGGYGVSGINDDGSWNYSATRNISAWASLQYKKKDCHWVPSLFLGYNKNLGTKDEIIGSFWCKNSANTVAQMYRIQADVLYNLGKVAFGIELMSTTVQYGKADSHMLVTDDLHFVSNHRIQAMVKYTF